MRIIMTIMLFACMAFIPMNAATLADKEVTLTVSSDGASKEEAIRNALRSAIEQTYGTFVSSNTTLVNDELAKDEIATISSGNIKKYKEVITETLPNGRVYVTLQATVSISKLVSYAKSKGATVEFDGASLAFNIEKEMLDTQSQDKVLENLAIQLKSLFYHGYDYSLEVLDVSNSSEGVGISFEVTASPNDNFKKAISLLHETLANLHVPTKQQVSTTQYRTVNIIETKFPNNVRTGLVTPTNNKEYILRASSNLEEWLATIWCLLYLGINNYAIQDKVGVHSIIATNKRLYGKYRKSYDLLKEVERYPINALSIPRDYLFDRHLFGGAINTMDANLRFTIYRMKMKEKVYLNLESLSTLRQYGDFKIQSKGE